MKVILAAVESALADAWEHEFHGIANVHVHRGSIFEVSADALVSPANSFGFMDGGIDALYSDFFGWGLESRLREALLDRHYGELLVGAAEIVSTEHDEYPFLIAAPTMRVPMILDRHTINPFLATRAALLLIRHEVFLVEPFLGMRISDRVRTVALPGMGTGVGQVPPALCARQMRAAFDHAQRDRIEAPSSWIEASDAHQLLYTDRPTSLR